ncbi:hypothetical protein CMV_012510 [Castanea mollissima]|uniref:Uncharacterized protein n=1 Tax=Castanea mollissima TaxID=60419 RepID=A0A8J4VN34_9ROSI|nr:hypothetical protein CMV_012510 [Castanea mollissima]
MSVTLRRNELMRSIYDIFSKSAATTRHTEMCKMKVKEMVELIEKDMANLNMERVVDANNDGLIDESEIATNGDGLMKSSHDDLPILDPPYVRQKGITNKRIKYNLEKCKRRAPKDVTRSTWYKRKQRGGVVYSQSKMAMAALRREERHFAPLISLQPITAAVQSELGF